MGLRIEFQNEGSRCDNRMGIKMSLKIRSNIKIKKPKNTNQISPKK